MEYEFEMPWPPSVNTMWRSCNGRNILSKKGREYRVEAIRHLKYLGLSDEQLSERLSLVVMLNPPTRRKYDIDNFCKGLFDALSHADFWLDDEQIDHLTILKGDVVKGGGVKVSVTIM